MKKNNTKLGVVLTRRGEVQNRKPYLSLVKIITKKTHHLSSKVDYIQEMFPNAEAVILDDFNVHNNNCLKYSETEAFAITHDLTQLVEESTRIQDNVNHHHNPLELFLTSDPDKYKITINAPLGKSDHSRISASCFTQAISTNCTVLCHVMNYVTLMVIK